VRGAGGWGFAVPEAHRWVCATLAEGRRLREAAAELPGTLLLVGRGPVYAMPALSGGRWVVRPYRRGGRLAGPLLRDRHLKGGVPRPLAEARASAELGRRGLPTPRVLAGAVYPAGAFYRADIVTEYIPASQDLAAHLLSEEVGGPARALALREARSLIRRMAGAGVDHSDMNARNILLTLEGEVPVFTVLDLDRCRLRPPGRAAAAAPMLRRLERSLGKILGRAGHPLSDAELAELR
jgi:3-deoxy-D-manno-octulosonic acid kinase